MTRQLLGVGAVSGGMCGIAGMLVRDGSPAAVGDLCRMAGALEHRGPDETGDYRDAHVGLAHARLSIIDLSTGQQPMANEDDSLWVVFNGEIFNYVELREELEQRGHRFRTKSDTEVIVHAFEEWGSEAFARFNGQFAIALWDEQRRILTLARDRVGVRPLYICEHAGKVYFASEVKAIFAADRTIPRALDPIGLDETFTFWSVVPPQSVFRGIEELRPGHVRSYGPEGMREHAYSEASFEVSFRGSIEDATAEVRRALEEATRLRMLRADVRVGSYLSGGLDSSLVAALGLRAKGDKFRTFSLRFADAEYDETMYQREMSAFLGSDHAEVMVTRRDIAEVFPAVISHTERPILRTAPAPMFLLSRLVRSEGIKVVLTGEGADEMFAGYDIFREAKVRRFWAKEPASKSRPRLLERLYPYLARSPVAQRAMAQQFFGRGLDRAAEPGFAHDTRWRGAAALKRLLAPSDSMDTVGRFLGTLPAAFEGWSALARDQYIEIRTLLTGYILSSQGDRMLMASSVEGRFPFLDANVMALAHSLPPAYKLKVLDEKHVLKRAGRELLPASILARKKQPYRAPDALSFVGEDAPGWIADALSEPSGIFDPKLVAQLWAKCRARQDQFSNADNMALVGVLSTQLLYQQFVRAWPQGKDVALTTLVDRLEGPRAPSV